MFNDDLIAYLQPLPNQFNASEWRDVTGSINDLHVEPHRFTLRASLPAGFYRCRVDTKPNAFDMKTAMVPMVRVPDGGRVLVGPWDLNHIEGYMAMPMARTYVNGKLKGGLWFDMPGPEQIAQGRLAADFGFEAEEGGTELVLEFVERDRQRLDWSRICSMEFRKDNRSLCPLVPKSRCHPRIYVNAEELPGLRRRLLPDPKFQAIIEELQRNEISLGAEGQADLACLVYLLTRDKAIGEKVRDKIVELCRKPTWSGRPDPLLMGGDNDRGVGCRLYYTGFAWECLDDLLNRDQRRIILTKAEEYLRKMYDFTLLQRAYMGHPTTEPHSLGAWNGVGVACMAFYDDLPVARKALPFFHGLFRDSLSLFPPGGKSAWATYFPFHLIRYLAAAHTFGGQRPELTQSSFLDNLGQALLACFKTPNTQELQRGLRTVEHRYLMAYLNRFHPVKGIEAIYQAFVEEERKTAGDVKLTIFDLLYAPTKRVKPAAFPKHPLFAKDIADIILTSRGKKIIGCSLSAGLKGGAKASFTLMPHNRDYSPSLASLEVSVDGAPVLMNVNIGTYNLNSALTNTMCFDDGGALTNGQYLNGEIGPEKSSCLRCCFINERFVYAHAVIADTLHPKLQVRRAERIMIVDLKTGIILLNDSFAGDRVVRFGTHLHCSGSVKDLGAGCYRLTGGQAGLIVGIKGGSKGLRDEEKGEIFASVLDGNRDGRVVVEEPSWIPSYIYGLNNTGKEDIGQGRFPRYSRWRLEKTQPVSEGSFLFALSAEADGVRMRENRICFPQSAWCCFGGKQPVHALDCECVAEAVLVDEMARKLVLIGAHRLVLNNRTIEFKIPTDLELNMTGKNAKGTVFSSSRNYIAQTKGFHVHRLRSRAHRSRSSHEWSANIEWE